MPDIADELDQLIYQHPLARVYLADALTDFVRSSGGFDLGGTLEFEIYCTSLSLKAAPDIDQAELEFDFATQIPIGETDFVLDPLAPSDLLGKAVRIEIDDTTVDPEAENQNAIVWFGVIMNVETVGAGIGKLLMTAMGPLQLAENHIIHTAHSLNNAGDSEIRTELGRPFNSDDRDVFGPVGNRAATKLSGQNHYLFAFEDRGRSKWTAQTALAYLLAKQTPLDSNGAAQPEWVMDTDTAETAPADWYDVEVSTDGKSLKAVFDELIPRKRAMSYYVWYDPTVQKIKLKIFTFLAEDLDVVTGDVTRTMPANLNQFEVDPSTNVWFGADLKIVESVEAQYDQIEALGERATTTCTLSLDPEQDEFVKDWSDEEEAAYKAGVGDIAANGRYRTEDKVSHIYSRFRLSDTYDGRAQGGGGDDYWIDPLLDVDGDPMQPYHAENAPIGDTIRVRGLRILPRLPFKERLDYGADNLAGEALQEQIAASVDDGDGAAEYRAPMFIHVGADYVLLDQMATATKSATDPLERRAFSCNCFLPRHEPAIQLKVTSGRQTLFAKDDFTDPAATGLYAAEWDPVAKNGINYADCVATVCIQLERRLRIAKTISAESITTRPRRTLTLSVDDARMDYVVPRTIVDIHEGGVAYSTTSGGYVRDDRERVRAVVNATAEWYGRIKRAVEFSYKQPRKLLSIGDLITFVGGAGLSQDINTPVTSIVYLLGNGNQGGETKLSTGFAEVDFL